MLLKNNRHVLENSPLGYNILLIKSYYERATVTDGLSMYLSFYECLYPSSAHSFDLIVMKLGMNTHWDPRSVMG